MIFRLYHTMKGGHVHCRLFAGIRDGALGNCGSLTMRAEEFAMFQRSAGFIQFRDEDKDPGRPVPHHGSGPDNV